MTSESLKFFCTQTENVIKFRYAHNQLTPILIPTCYYSCVRYVQSTKLCHIFMALLIKLEIWKTSD